MSPIFVSTEIVRNSSYQKNIGTEFTHLFISSLCWETIMNCHNLGQPNLSIEGHISHNKDENDSAVGNW